MPTGTMRLERSQLEDTDTVALLSGSDSVKLRMRRLGNFTYLSPHVSLTLGQNNDMGLSPELESSSARRTCVAISAV